MRSRHWAHLIAIPTCVGFITGAHSHAGSPHQSTAVEAQRAILGDLNGDGVVDVADLEVLLRNYGLTDVGPTRGDLNGDGVVDRADLRLLLSHFGAAVSDVDVLMALERAGVLDVEGPQPEPPPSPWGTHHPVISNAQHSQAFSQSHPNHDQTYSNGWPHWPNNHDGGLSGVWPPNHYGDISSSWPPGHNQQASGHWPPSHLIGVSVHNPDNPQTWPPPGQHNAALSITWPPGHNAVESQTVPPNQWQDHNHLFSNLWPNGPNGHPNWPPNHFHMNSQGWGNHAQALSVSWPPNHFAVITASWGPNHNAAVSSTWPPNYHSRRNSLNANVVDIDVIDNQHHVITEY